MSGGDKEISSAMRTISLSHPPNFLLNVQHDKQRSQQLKYPLILTTLGEEGQPDFWESLRQSSGITKSVIVVLATFVNIIIMVDTVIAFIDQSQIGK